MDKQYFPEGAETRYISPRCANEVKKRLVILDQLETQAADIRTVMLHLISEDTRIDLEKETWGVDLDHFCVVKQDAEPAAPSNE